MGKNRQLEDLKFLLVSLLAAGFGTLAAVGLAKEGRWDDCKMAAAIAGAGYLGLGLVWAFGISNKRR